jgi:glycosyltransferase involved in cell wall biosynthesis
MRWTVVIPVYNERAFLAATIGSLAAQQMPFRLIIVDNGSDDGCINEARAQANELVLDASFLSEPTPGQVHALRRGIAAVTTELVAICDADTWYPPHYLREAERLFDARGAGCVATAACLKPEGASGLQVKMSLARRLLAARLMPRQNHTSGAAHCFRTAALREAGGYDARFWPYVLKDHELMHRVLKLGTQAYDPAFWCVTSARRGDRRRVRWTLVERLAYHLWPNGRKDAFFYQFLARRLEARGQRDTVLRQQPWLEAAVAR